MIHPVRIGFVLLVRQVLLGFLLISADTQLENDSVSVEITSDGRSNECSSRSSGDCVGVPEQPVYAYDSILKNDLSALELDHISEVDLATYEDLMHSNKFEAEHQNTTLRQVLIIHRHGDRTPINFAPKDSLAKEPFWQFHGLGQLTNRGKARVHMLGQIIRKRYNIFMGGSVNKNNRKSRSSGSLRCIESAQGFLSSFLGLDVDSSPDAGALSWDKQSDKLAHIWQPASINTIASSIDGMLNEGATCNALLDEYQAMDSSPIAKRLLIDYKYEADKMKELVDFDMDHFYKWFWASSFLEVESSYFKSKMSPKLLEIYDKMQEAGDISLGLYQSSDKVKHLYCGLLINDMITNMKEFRDSLKPNVSDIDTTFIKRFVHYSSHDLNLIGLLGIFDSWQKFATRPDYASNIIIELHEHQDEWFVRLFYMAHVPAELIELHLETCEKGHERQRCTLDKFDSIMAKYKIKNWQTWMKSCNNDLSLIDPYKQNA